MNNSNDWLNNEAKKDSEESVSPNKLVVAAVVWVVVVGGIGLLKGDLMAMSGMLAKGLLLCVVASLAGYLISLLKGVGAGLMAECEPMNSKLGKMRLSPST